MYVRAIFTVLLAAVVVACPYVHTGSCSASSCAHAAPAATCDAHDHGHDCPAPEPVPVPARDAGTDCLCSGAVLASSVRVDIQDSQSQPCLVAFDLTQLGTAATTLAASPVLETSFYGGCHFPPLLSGRDLTTLVCVRLI